MDKDTSLTPLDFLQSLGRFDMDPCGILQHPTADKIVQWPNDGLAAQWSGRVWCNPPYSNPKPFMKRMFEHQNGIALVLASTGADWFQRYAFPATAVLFLAKRPRFTRLDGSRFQIMRDCCLVAFSLADAQVLVRSEIEGTLV